MSGFAWAIRSVLLVSCLFTASACKSSSTSGSRPNEPTASDDLLEVAGLLKDYSTEFGRGPARLEDTEKNQPLYPRGYEAIKSGRMVVTWNVAVAADGSGGTGIVAFEKKAETEGGAVLLQNGQVKNMTADEFRASPRSQ